MTRRFPGRRAPVLFVPPVLGWLMLVLLLAWPAGGALAQGAGGRVALVVGVSGYASLPSLPGVPDTTAEVARQFEGLGYAVTTLTDPDRAGFDVALAVFARQAEGAEAAVVYFAGHALGAGGVTRLALLDSRVTEPADAPGQTFPLEAVVARLARPDRPTAIVIDARTLALPAALHGGLTQPAPVPGVLLALAEGGGAGAGLFAQGWVAELAVAGRQGDATVDAILAGLGERLAEGGKGAVRLSFVSTLAAPLPLAGPVPDAQADAPGGEAPTGAPPVFVIPRFGEVPAPDPDAVSEVPEVAIVEIPEDLPRAVQQELARLGCYAQRVDGIWGRGSRAALAEFARRSNQGDLGGEPTADVWLVVRAASGTVCPPRAAPEVRGSTFAAIAFSPATYTSPEGAANGWGGSANRPSAQVAASAAIRACNNGDPSVIDCRVVLRFSGGCGAVAAGGAGLSVVHGVGQGRTEAAARNAAVADCRRRGGGCRALGSICTP